MRKLTALLALAVAAQSVSAQERQRPEAGPFIESGGAVFSVDPSFATPMDLEYKVAFEVVNAAGQPNRPNQTINSAARFLNMHGQAGLSRDKVGVALVVHGGAAFELLDDAAYRERHSVDNPNKAVILELIEQGTPVVLCGQSAASRGIAQDQLIDGVQIALSAMTAFVVLQERGYKVNPW